MKMDPGHCPRKTTMRKLILATLTAASLMVTPTAHADEGANIALGVLGGIVLGGAFFGSDHNHYERRRPYVEYYPPPPPVYYYPPPQPRYYQPYCERRNYYDYYGNYNGSEIICR